MSVSRLGMAVALVLLSVASLEAQATKIGYINVQEVLSQYPPFQAARDQLEGASNRWNAELQQAELAWQTSVQEYQQQQMTMTPEARQIRELEIESQRRAFESRSDELTNQGQALQAELFQPIMNDVTAVMEEIRLDGGYGLILDSGTSVILAADESLNLTPDLLTRLQERDAAKAGR